MSQTTGGGVLILGVERLIPVSDLMMPSVDYNNCTLCEKCVQQCPQQVVCIVDGRLCFVREQNCTYCGVCEEVCPTGAIQLVYQIVLLNAVTKKQEKEVIRDERVY